MRNPQTLSEFDEEREAWTQEQLDKLTVVETIVQAYLDTPKDSVWYNPIATLAQLADLLGLEETDD